MQLQKRTYTIPQQLITKFEETVKPRERSSRVAEMMREWMEQEEKKQFLSELTENADYMKDVYQQIQDEFRQIDDEELRKIEY